TIVSVDPSQGMIVITDLGTNKRLQAQVISDSTVRRLSAEVVQILSARIQGGKPPAAQSGSGAEPSQPPGSQDLQSAIEKLPPFSVTNLKPGEAVILSCANSTDAS